MKLDPNSFTIHALHHVYIGISLIFLGIMAIGQPWSYDLGLWLIGIGSYVTIDDIIEHTIHRNTPLRIIFDKILWPLFKNKK